MTGDSTDYMDQLEDLQMKVAYQEDTIQSLNDVVVGQSQAIARINEQVQLLNQKLRQFESGVDQSDTNTIDERPPHY
jgi:SlyX protein